MAPFFTPKAVDAYLPVLVEEAQRLAPRWERAARDGQPAYEP